MWASAFLWITAIAKVKAINQESLRGSNSNKNDQDINDGQSEQNDQNNQMSLFLTGIVEETGEAESSIKIQASNQENGANYVQRWIISSKPAQKKVLKTEITSANSELKVARDNNISNSPIVVHLEVDEINLLSVSATEEQIKQLMAKSNSIELVQLDSKVYPAHQGFEKLYERDLAQVFPYGVAMVQSPYLWELGYKGQGVKVCVIDTGIDYYHKDFKQSNLLGHDFLNGVSWQEDACFHGTHVSGIISAQSDDFDSVGVAPEAEIITMRVFKGEPGGDCGYAYSSEIIAAAYECKNYGARIISISIVGGSPSEYESNLYQDLFDTFDIMTIAAAGNDISSAYSYPASYPAVMSVAAIDENEDHAYFSQYNDDVEIAAPGVRVESLYANGGIIGLSGTSMATPHVAGVAALLLSAFPGASAAQVRAAMTFTAKDKGAPGRDDYFGYGIIQAKLAYEYLADVLAPTISPAPSTSPAPSSTPSLSSFPSSSPTLCWDDPPGWHDSDGTDFDCAWYASDDNCESLGDMFENFGKTANEACCVCGGGLTGKWQPSSSPTSSSATETLFPSMISKTTLSPAPIASTISPTIGHRTTSSPTIPLCRDTIVDWYDFEGPHYKCQWYGNNDNCANYGSSFENFGFTAQVACCVCGGGILSEEILSSSPSATPSAIPSGSPTNTPSNAPTNTPSGSPTNTPSDSPTNSPSDSPTNSPIAGIVRETNWEILSYDNFFSGQWGHWIDGGSYVSLIKKNIVGTNGYVVQLQDKSDKHSSMVHLPLDVTDFVNLEVKFTFYMQQMGKDDKFFLEWSTNGGQNWTKLMDWSTAIRLGSENIYYNDKLYQDETVYLSSENFGLNFQIRFRCSANGRKGIVYIDKVQLSGLRP